MIIENKEIGIRFEVDNQQDFDKWYAIRKEQIRSDAINEYTNVLCNHFARSLSIYTKVDIIVNLIKQVAKQLKEK